MLLGLILIGVAILLLCSPWILERSEFLSMVALRFHWIMVSNIAGLVLFGAGIAITICLWRSWR